MATKIHEFPGKLKKMHFEYDAADRLVKVTDESGAQAKTVEHGDLKIKFGDIEATIVDVPEGTTFVTKHNPTCYWVYKNGRWYYICV